MSSDFAKYLGIAGGLIFVYLVIYYDRGSTSVINSLSKANTNTILALQGRQVSPF